MTFSATKQSVLNRGSAPESFLRALVEWGKTAAEEIFAPNPNNGDVYALTSGTLGPFRGSSDGEDFRAVRRAAMLEIMRVHAGFESSWNWNEGVDRNNPTSMKHIEGQETGAWQVSFDSTFLGGGAMEPFAKDHGIETAAKFIPAMKTNHPLAMEYYVRLVRVSIQWAGPLATRKILPELKVDAMKEFKKLLES